MIKDEKISIKTTNKNISYYRNFDNTLKSGDVIEINISQLSKGSKQIVVVECDNCKNIKEISYKDYLRVIKNDMYYCFKCKDIKIKNTNQEKHGVDNVFQLQETKDKSKETCLEKYGVDYYQKSEEYKNKAKNTNLEKYGVEYPMQNNNIKEKSIKNCNRENIILKTKETRTLKYRKLFETRSNKIHNNRYNYDNSFYINMNTKVQIECDIHGVFEQRPKDHIHNRQGCPKCNISKGENVIIEYLENHNIKYEHQKKFKECIYKIELPFDFYLPEYNMCIEFDGIQHFESVEYFGGEDAFELRKMKDKIKTKYCRDNSIILERITYSDDILERLEIIL